MSEELLRCPFCTGARTDSCLPVVKKVSYGEYTNCEYSVYCQNCGASGATYSNKNDAIDAWNNRPTQDETIKTLTDALIKIKKGIDTYSNDCIWINEVADEALKESL